MCSSQTPNIVKQPFHRAHMISYAQPSTDVILMNVNTRIPWTLVSTSQIESWGKLLLPARGFGVITLATVGLANTCGRGCWMKTM
ncbi:hypothetical protein B0H10DRAFT_683929 [Mycena sp. CBHHK59/15]|nr:hypothetical protein B0H10DRAFT_683929 [Mycena sp. CBHHK59/15]